MTHLIDKDALVAEIEKRQRELCVLSHSNDVELRKDAAIQNGVYCSLLSFINTLEVKEVDLNSAIEYYVEQHKSELNGYFDIRRIAKHFFALGLKAKQG